MQTSTESKLNLKDDMSNRKSPFAQYFNKVIKVEGKADKNTYHGGVFNE